MLYVAQFSPDAEEARLEGLDACRLGPGLYLIRAEQTQSELYHRIKRAVSPDSLLVGRLADDPKFKGMEAGALKWLRK